MSKKLNTQLQNLIRKLDETNRKPITEESSREWSAAKADLARFVLQHQDRIVVVPVPETATKGK